MIPTCIAHQKIPWRLNSMVRQGGTRGLLEITSYPAGKTRKTSSNTGRIPG